MPIFDADCHPYMHTGQIQAMPQPMPLPAPMPQLPMMEEIEEEEEIQEVPMPRPPYPPMPSDWQLIESPEMPEMVMPAMEIPPSVPCPPEQGYVPQQIAPAVQYNYPPMQYPEYFKQWGCNCGGVQPMMMPVYHGRPCSCHSMMHPTPYPMMQAPYQGYDWNGSD